MRALYMTGRQTEALAVYRDVRQRLVDELAIEPGEELRGLEVAILAHDPALGATPAPPATGIPPAPATPTFGREDDLAAVTTLLGDDEVRLVTITGPAASGRRGSQSRWPGSSEGASCRSPRLTTPTSSRPGCPPRPRHTADARETAEAALARTYVDRRTVVVLDNLEHVLAAGVAGAAAC